MVRPRVIRFGVFELNLRSGELRKSGVKIKLQEKPLQVLALLLEKPGEVVTSLSLRLTRKYGTG
jgi:DNA-binding winged helix-turn-helix (wHTH) protein